MIIGISPGIGLFSIVVIFPSFFVDVPSFVVSVKNMLGTFLPSACSLPLISCVAWLTFAPDGAGEARSAVSDGLENMPATLQLAKPFLPPAGAPAAISLNAPRRLRSTRHATLLIVQSPQTT